MKRWPVLLAAMCVAMALSAAIAPGRAESVLTRVDRSLSWPEELPRDLPPGATRFQPAKSNYVIDLHGSVANPDLVVFMAGNQYRALPDLTREFRKWIALQPQWKGLPAENIFYATLPPGKLIEAMESGLLVLGNYWLEVSPARLWPDVFMTGPRQQQRLFKLGLIDRYTPYASNRGSVLLVRAGNPLRINGVNDLARPEVRVAISSPAREAASYDSYSSTIDAQGGAGLSKTVLAKSNTLTPDYVHHRENPQFIADQLADVAPMYLPLRRVSESAVSRRLRLRAASARGQYDRQSRDRQNQVGAAAESCGRVDGIHAERRRRGHLWPTRLRPRHERGTRKGSRTQIGAKEPWILASSIAKVDAKLSLRLSTILFRYEVNGVVSRLPRSRSCATRAWCAQSPRDDSCLL